MARSLLVCLLITLGALTLAAHPADSQQNAITGTVLDPGRAPIPRANVRLLDAAGAELDRTLADSQGRFRFSGLAAARCRVEASLVGFETASADASPGSTVELTLPLAPVRESIVVSATRT